MSGNTGSTPFIQDGPEGTQESAGSTPCPDAADETPFYDGGVGGEGSSDVDVVPDSMDGNAGSGSFSRESTPVVRNGKDAARPRYDRDLYPNVTAGLRNYNDNNNHDHVIRTTEANSTLNEHPNPSGISSNVPAGSHMIQPRHHHNPNRLDTENTNDYQRGEHSSDNFWILLLCLVLLLAFVYCYICWVQAPEMEYVRKRRRDVLGV